MAGKLTARRCDTAGPGKHEDGDGLRLVVSATGAKKWVLRVTVAGKRREMGLGAYGKGGGEVSLAQARALADKARAQVAAGVDPVQARRVEVATVPTFTQVAARFIRAHRRGWSNYKHARQWPRSLTAHVRPVIGDLPIDAITTEAVLQVLQPIWTTRTVTAKRVQGRMESILDYAAALRLRDPINPARWRGHLDTLLPAPRRVREVERHAAMPYDAAPGFMRELEQDGSLSAKALRLLILTAVRSNELLASRWEEFNLESRTWTIPASRTKARREHRVPLSGAALAILETLPRVDGCPYLLPGLKPGTHITRHFLNLQMKRMGYTASGARGDYTVHGFRSSFRDWAGEVSHYPNIVAEAALGHAVGGVEGAYRRGDLLAKRAAMMADWAAWCSRTPAQVVDLAEARSRPA